MEQIGDIAYRPDPIEGRKQAWRCGGCHRTLSRCNCATPAPLDVTDCDCTPGFPHKAQVAATPAPLDVMVAAKRLVDDWDNGEGRYAANIDALRTALAATPAPLDDDVRGDNQAALESLPDAVQAVDFNLPPRVIVCQHGHYWRDYGDFLSMCPVSEDNLSCSPQTVYAPAPLLANLESSDQATPAPLDVERLAMAVNKASHYPDPVNEHVRKLARAIAAAYAEEAECD